VALYVSSPESAHGLKRGALAHQKSHIGADESRLSAWQVQGDPRCRGHRGCGQPLDGAYAGYWKIQPHPCRATGLADQQHLNNAPTELHGTRFDFRRLRRVDPERDQTRPRSKRSCEQNHSLAQRMGHEPRPRERERHVDRVRAHMHAGRLDPDSCQLKRGIRSSRGRRKRTADALRSTAHEGRLRDPFGQFALRPPERMVGRVSPDSQPERPIDPGASTAPS